MYYSNSIWVFILINVILYYFKQNRDFTVKLNQLKHTVYLNNLVTTMRYLSTMLYNSFVSALESHGISPEKRNELLDSQF